MNKRQVKKALKRMGLNPDKAMVSNEFTFEEIYKSWCKGQKDKKQVVR